jgi:hypothetical protein
MGRREDVFFTANAARLTLSPASRSGRTPPSRRFDRCFRTASIADRPVFPQRPSIPERPVSPERIAVPEKPVQAAVPEQPAFQPKRLEQLSIKQDLNRLVQK